MNKHIERFAIEAGLDIDSYDRYGSFDEEKFAQLIVKECADLCLKYAEYTGPFNTMEFRTGQNLYTILRNQFGVDNND